MPRVLAYLALMSSVWVPLEQPAALAERFVVVPATEGKSCVDLDSRWGLGVLLTWRQRICDSDDEGAWVQTDCSQNFAADGYWMAVSEDGRSFDRKVNYNEDQVGSSIAQYVCLTVGRE